MIKFLKIITLSSLLVVISGISSQAFLLPPGPVTPTVDAPTDVAFTLKNVASTAQNYAAQMQAYANNATKAVKAAKSNYLGKFTGFMGGLFQKKEKQAIPGSKTIQESKIADIYDPEDVKKALYTLFLAYPSKCEGPDDFAKCVAYKAKGEEFYQDTVIEIYTSVRLLEEELVTLNQQVDKLSTTFAGGSTGGDGAESGEDENGVWKNAYNAYETMDSILKITQEVIAMKMQYEAALLLKNNVEPAPYLTKKERKAKEKAAEEAAKTSYFINSEKIKIASTGKFAQSQTLAFGQLLSNSQSRVQLQTVSGSTLNTASSSNKSTLSTSSVAAQPAAMGSVSSTGRAKSLSLSTSSVAAQPAAMGSVNSTGSAKSLNVSTSGTTAGSALPINTLSNSSVTKTQVSLPVGLTTQQQINQNAAISASAAEEEDDDDDDDDEDYVYDPTIYGNVTFADADKPLISSPFAGNEEKMLELDKIAPVYDKAQEALIVHNLLQSLDSYQEIFKSYEQYKKLHDKAIAAVEDADKCAIQYLGRRYASPEKVWKGDMADAAVNDYDARQGISGWAIEAFTLAKSEESTPIEPDDLGTMELDMDVDLDDANSADKLQKDIEKQNNSGLANPSQTEEVEKSTRESQLISFNIGAEAAKLLVEDQYKSTPQWAKPTKNFPIWNDQISFYNQYITGKYNNIKDYLQQFDVSSLIVEIAYPLNNMLVEDEDERANNQAGLDKLASSLKQESYSDPSSVLTELENNRDKLLDQALQSKNSRLQSLENQKKTLQSQLDRASTLASDYSEQLNTYQQNKLSAQTNADVQSKQIKYLEERRGDISDNTVTKTDVEYTTQSYEVSPEKNKTTYSSEYNEEKEEDVLFDTQEAIQDYTDKIQKLNYKVKNQQNLMPTQVNSNSEGAVSLYPETLEQSSSTSENSSEKKQLFRTRPFSDNRNYQPQNVSKYRLSETLYFGAQYPISYASEKAKLDAELDSQVGQEIEKTNYEAEDVATQETVAAQTIDYTEEETKETQELNLEEGENMTLAEELKSENLATAAKNQELADETKVLVDQKNEEIKQLNSKLDAIEEQISAIEQDYINQVQEIESAYNQKLSEAQAYIEQKRQAKKTLDLISYYQEKIGLPVPGLDGLTPPFSLLHILEVATNLTDDTKSYAEQLVDDAKKSILNLGDEVYIGAYGSQIVQIHANLMTKLQSLPIEGLSQYSSSLSSYAKTNSIIKPLSSMFQKLMLEKVCQNDSCKQADSEYFVGAYAKSRDFLAPKNSLQEYLPPLREIVHFDDVDHDNIPQSTDGGISKDGFLNSGAQIPEIWKLILSNKAFVDKDIDLKTLLSEGDEVASFMRGGRYPCRLDDMIVDVRDKSGEFTIYTSRSLPVKSSEEEQSYRPDDMSTLPECKDITLENGEGLLGKLYMTIKDKTKDVSAPAKVDTLQAYSGNSPHSELGTLLKATDKGIYYNDAPEEVFARLQKMAKEQEDSSSYEENMQDVVYQKAFLDHNQIGNFLSFVEQEQSYRQAMEELKMSADEAKEDLFEQFEKIGFEPSADYDLAKQEDYDLTKETLNRYKNELLQEIDEGLAGINITDNAVVEERYDKIKNIFTALSKDKEAYISISDTTDSGSELDERIKTEEVNRQVTTEYKKKADEEFEKQLSEYPIPFCAAY